MIPSFCPIETWAMGIFPYLENYDTTINNITKNHIHLILLIIETHKHQFSQMTLQGDINKTKLKIYFIYKKVRKTCPYNANSNENYAITYS